MEQDILITYKTVPKGPGSVFFWWIWWDHAVSHHPWQISPPSDIHCYLFSERISDWDKKTFSERLSKYECNTMDKHFLLPDKAFRSQNHSSVLVEIAKSHHICICYTKHVQGWFHLCFIEKEMDWNAGTWLYSMSILLCIVYRPKTYLHKLTPIDF